MTRLAISALLLVAGCDRGAPPAASNDSAPIGSTNAVENRATTATDMPPHAEVPGAHPSAPEPAPIPANFRGAWAETKALCADLKHHSRLTISGRTIRYPDFVLFGDEFTTPAANQFAVRGKVEGTSRPAEAHFSIDAAGNVLTDEAGGGSIRVRCS